MKPSTICTAMSILKADLHEGHSNLWNSSKHVKCSIINMNYAVAVNWFTDLYSSLDLNESDWNGTGYFFAK